MSASKNLHDNIFEIFAGISQDHLKRVLNEQPESNEYDMGDWLNDIKRNDVWASDALWNSVDLSYHIQSSITAPSRKPSQRQLSTTTS